MEFIKRHSTQVRNAAVQALCAETEWRAHTARFATVPSERLRGSVVLPDLASRQMGV